ncbi:MAG: diguanylate cyclase [Actinobacteria bacterium]|nr:MAG: diguanylate cyclase [Actinomycetota bacterium]
MKYSRFELLVLVFGGGAVLGTAVSALLKQTDLVEVAAQLLLLVVLVGALHWGRRGGYAAALLAVAAYLLLRAPMILRAGGLTPTLLQLLITRSVVYGTVGIVGGEICSRIKYFFVKLEDRDYIDDVTHLYNTTYLKELLRGHVAQHQRYGAVFSLIMLSIKPERMPANRQEGRRLLREAGNALLGDIRLVDEIGRYGESVFCIILPNTPLSGARVAAGRLIKTASAAIAARAVDAEGAVATETLGYPGDAERVSELAGIPTGQGTAGDIAGERPRPELGLAGPSPEQGVGRSR